PPPHPLFCLFGRCQLQKLKQSLSFKTNSVRSKSADNFFQQTNCGTKLQVDLLSEITSKMGQLPNLESQNSTPTKTHLQPEDKTHIFEEHIFKKPTFCDVCNHMIVACGNKVDPVYETLRFGTSLAQKTKKGNIGSSSDSPKRNSTSDLAEVPEERGSLGNMFDLNRQRSNSGDNLFSSSLPPPPFKGSLNTDTIQMNIYVALYKFVPQEHEDLEMRPGDRIILLEDSNEDWWKGKIEDRIGFFPANFVQRLQDEKVFKCIRTFIGCKEQGQITLKENQICISSEKEHDGFIKVCSGKKKGFVPIDVLEDI
uniref:SH3 and cysteine rich domain n=1 Tax=Naja naja TaxID=35670 RepID=A0A8C6XXI6_NAJNA